MQDKFVERHVGASNSDLAEMLKVIGVNSVEELISQVLPANIRLKEPLKIAREGMSEYEFTAHIKALAAKNNPYRTFIGMGYYPTATSAAIMRNIFENPAWYTSYTPYQAEISQGRLEALLNFQTMVISLTGMEISNCSLLDEGTATAEAMFMMFNARSRGAARANKNV
ncbi:MAG: glycine dehydrogenase (aminomethyl-transferring), partial [Rikenellaceae bacterium]